MHPKTVEMVRAADGSVARVNEEDVAAFAALGYALPDAAPAADEAKTPKRASKAKAAEQAAS